MILATRWALDFYSVTSKYDKHRVHRVCRRALVKYPSRFNPRLTHALLELYRLRYAVAIGRHDNRAICISLSERGIGRPWEIIERRFKTWPKYSGNPSFPVPSPAHPDDMWAAEISYRQANCTRNMWSGEYGKQRIELLDHLIADVELDVFGGYTKCKK